VARIATDDEKKIKDILNEVGMLLRDIWQVPLRKVGD
jgi:hypothetical protein